MSNDSERNKTSYCVECDAFMTDYDCFCDCDNEMLDSFAVEFCKFEEHILTKYPTHFLNKIIKLGNYINNHPVNNKFNCKKDVILFRWKNVKEKEENDQKEQDIEK